MDPEHIARRLESIDSTLAMARPAFEAFAIMVEAYRHHLRSESAPSAWKAISIINNDKELKTPQKKLLLYLAHHIDSSTGRHREVHFSQLVKDAKVGKSKAQHHLAMLKAKGYVQHRSDGYRTFYRFCG